MVCWQTGQELEGVGVEVACSIMQVQWKWCAHCSWTSSITGAASVGIKRVSLHIPQDALVDEEEAIFWRRVGEMAGERAWLLVDIFLGISLQIFHVRIEKILDA